jgi:uncharacterized protein (TIGR00369 family)
MQIAALHRPRFCSLHQSIAFTRGAEMAIDDPGNPASWPQIVNEQPPFALLIGAQIVSASADQVEAELVVRPELLNRNGVLHGGAILAVADNLGGTAAFVNLGAHQGTTTMESKTNFFRAIPPGDLVRFVCIPLHKGAKTMVFQTSVYRGDGKLAAVVTQTQIVLSREDSFSDRSPARHQP